MSRNTVLFDDNWKFRLGDHTGFASVSCCDDDWRLLDLPHDYSIEGEFNQNNPSGGDGAYLPAGVGWYRKHFTRPGGPAVLITFDGVYQKCQVWLNGIRVGAHNYGYTSFEYDLTPYLVEGDNVLAVRVDNSEQPNSRWYTGSGIYRHVWLTEAEELRVAQWGVFVSTACVNEGFASINVEVELTKASDARVELSIFDACDNELAKISCPSALKLEYTFDLKDMELWSFENPVLYKLRTRIVNDGREMDRVDTPFGVRTISFHKDKGFSINGVHTKLNGVCIHHDGGSVGAAVPEVVCERRLKLLKDMGCNAIRMAHNPPSPELLDLCDKLGFYVMDEAFDEWMIIKRKSESGSVSFGYGQVFKEDSEKDLISMLRRDRNHPSVVLWSIGNEIPEQCSPEGYKIAKRLQDLCRREDPTRLVTSACDNVHADYNRTSEDFLKTLDVAGFNYINRWREHAETAYTSIRHRYPDMIMLGTEHGGVGGVRGGYNLTPPPGKWWSSKYNSRMIRAEHLLKQTMMHDYICGDFMWTGIDYLGEARWPSKNASSGLIDMCGLPKDGYYLYKSQWTREPMIHIFPHWNWNVEKGTVIPVLCYTNCNTIELFVNGKSFGEKAYEFPMQGMTERYGHFDLPHISVTTNDLHLSWDVPYEPGVIRAVGRNRYGEIQLIEEIHTTGTPAAIDIKIDPLRFAGKDEYAHVIISVVDEDGCVVPTAYNQVTVSVDGPVRLIGLDNGDPEDLTAMNSPVRKVSAGMAVGIIKRLEDEGEAVITVSAPGLKPAQVIL